MIKKVEFRGAGVGNPVPFTKSDIVNEEEYCRHVEFMVQGGVSMLMPAPMVGCGVQLSASEWRRVVQLTVEQSAGRAFVFPMCYVPAGTKNTVELLREIKTIGVDGAYLPTPILWQSGPEAMYQHYGTILAETDIPIIVYSCPDTTGSAITGDIVERLALEYPGRILGLKQHRMSELPFDVARLGHLMNLAPTCFDRYTWAGLQLGCRAQVTIGGAFVPEVVSAIFRLYEDAEHDEAHALFVKHSPLFNLPPYSYFAIHRDFYAGTYYYLLSRVGFDFGQPRLPYLWPIPEELRRTVDEAVETLELAGVGVA